MLWDMMLFELLIPVRHVPLEKRDKRMFIKDFLGGIVKVGERVYVDISLIQGMSFGCSKFWALTVDDHLGYC
jgi:hypothetical protein